MSVTLNQFPRKLLLASFVFSLFGLSTGIFSQNKDNIIDSLRSELTVNRCAFMHELAKHLDDFDHQHLIAKLKAQESQIKQQIAQINTKKRNHKKWLKAQLKQVRRWKRLSRPKSSIKKSLLGLCKQTVSGIEFAGKPLVVTNAIALRTITLPLMMAYQLIDSSVNRFRQNSADFFLDTLEYSSTTSDKTPWLSLLGDSAINLGINQYLLPQGTIFSLALTAFSLSTGVDYTSHYLCFYRSEAFRSQKKDRFCNLLKEISARYTKVSSLTRLKQLETPSKLKPELPEDHRLFKRHVRYVKQLWKRIRVNLLRVDGEIIGNKQDNIRLEIRYHQDSDIENLQEVVKDEFFAIPVQYIKIKTEKNQSELDAENICRQIRYSRFKNGRGFGRRIQSGLQQIKLLNRQKYMTVADFYRIPSVKRYKSPYSVSHPSSGTKTRNIILSLGIPEDIYATESYSEMQALQEEHSQLFAKVLELRKLKSHKKCLVRALEMNIDFDRLETLDKKLRGNRLSRAEGQGKILEHLFHKVKKKLHMNWEFIVEGRMNQIDKILQDPTIANVILLAHGAPNNAIYDFYGHEIPVSFFSKVIRPHIQSIAFFNCFTENTSKVYQIEKHLKRESAYSERYYIFNKPRQDVQYSFVNGFGFFLADIDRVLKDINFISTLEDFRKNASYASIPSIDQSCAIKFTDNIIANPAPYAVQIGPHFIGITNIENEPLQFDCANLSKTKNNLLLFPVGDNSVPFSETYQIEVSIFNGPRTDHYTFDANLKDRKLLILPFDTTK